MNKIDVLNHLFIFNDTNIYILVKENIIWFNLMTIENLLSKYNKDFVIKEDYINPHEISLCKDLKSYYELKDCSNYFRKNQNSTYIMESALYSLITYFLIESPNDVKENIIEFKKWLVYDLIDTIRNVEINKKLNNITFDLDISVASGKEIEKNNNLLLEELQEKKKYKDFKKEQTRFLELKIVDLNDKIKELSNHICIVPKEDEDVIGKSVLHILQRKDNSNRFVVFRRQKKNIRKHSDNYIVFYSEFDPNPVTSFAYLSKYLKKKNYIRTSFPDLEILNPNIYSPDDFKEDLYNIKNFRELKSN